MSYESIDKMQLALAEDIFGYAKDKKKASGRALGTFVEILTFYLVKAWRLEEYMAIERRLPEYANPDIAHNVEFSLHPALKQWKITLPSTNTPITSVKIFNELPKGACKREQLKTSNQLLSSKSVLRNASTVWDADDSIGVATIANQSKKTLDITVSRLHPHPFAMFECKRVGVEEGNKKGPQTIEKAKQGAYVARAVSSLQKIRMSDGSLGGLVHLSNGETKIGDYAEMLDSVVASDDPELLCGFSLTIGVVSNHGNWFTSDDHNKELKVLAQSYDWLLFLTDAGLAEFITDVLLGGDKKYKVVHDAFLDSYGPKKVENKFTKVRMDRSADLILQEYVRSNLDRIDGWFNTISPAGRTIEQLKTDLNTLTSKDWARIHNDGR